MQLDKVIVRNTGNVAILTLNRPEMDNAIDSWMASELVQALNTVDGDDSVRAVVLTGTGDRSFSIGQDLDELAGATQEGGDFANLAAIRRKLSALDPWQRLGSLCKPTIAAVNGMALSEGLELALACDIRLAATTATFGFPDVRRGTIPSHGGTQRLSRIVGRAKAIEMLVTGDTIGATEARRTELVSRVVPGLELMSAAVELADRLAGYGPVAIRYARDTVSKGFEMTFDQGLRLETDLYALLQTTEDRLEGLRAFRQKRKPEFKGR